MSFLHFLTIGRFAYDADAHVPGLRERVLAHFVPGGLAAQQRVTGRILPFTHDEISRIEDELRRRFDLDAALLAQRTEHGLLRVEYARDPRETAWYVAWVGHELFGAVAGESGRLVPIEHVRWRLERRVAEERERARIASIEDLVARFQAVVTSLERSEHDPHRLSVPAAVSLLVGHEHALLRHLPSQLSSGSEEVRALVIDLLHGLGSGVAEIAPALGAWILDPRSGCEAHGVVRVFAVMGAAGEGGMTTGLRHALPSVRAAAAEALGVLGSASAAARARLVEMAHAEDRQERSSAKRALLELGQRW